MDLVQEEQFYTYLALTRASDALYLSYPAAAADGSAAEPSFLLERLKALGYYTENMEVFPPSPHHDDPSFFANPNQALSLLPEILRNGRPSPTGNWAALKDWAEGNEYRELMESKLAGLRYQNTAARLPKMLARKLFMKGGRFYGSVTKLQNYRSCPYQYFLRYGIGVEERNTGEADYLDYGNYLHAGLHQFGEVLKSQNRQWRQATDEEIEKISEDITEKSHRASRRMPFPRISRQSIPAAFWIRPSGGHFKNSVNGAGRAVSTRWIWKKNSISVFLQVPLTALPLQGR